MKRGRCLHSPVGFSIVIFCLGLAACKQSAVRDRCPLVPMQLVAELPEVGTTTVLEIDEQGRLSVALKPGEFIARFDPKGCLIGDDGPWVELTRENTLWTQRQVLGLDGADVLLGKRRLRITSDGEVMGIDEKGESEPVYAKMHFEAYSPEARCLAQVLLVAYLGMMPSMAVVDGGAKLLPPPERSVCRN